MHAHYKRKELREIVSKLKAQFLGSLNLTEDSKLSREVNSNMRKFIMKKLNISSQTYYVASMPYDKFLKRMAVHKSCAEKRKQDKYFEIYRKTRRFQKRGNKPTNGDYTYKDVVAKFGPNPICYLTGKPIDYSDGKSYSLDHIVPTSKGGDNSLSNLQIVTQTANRMKSDIDLDLFIKTCKEIAANYS